MPLLLDSRIVQWLGRAEKGVDVQTGKTARGSGRDADKMA